MKRLLTGFTALLLIVSGGMGVATPRAAADTLPASGVPATVSADPLPTVQVNGMVWDQAIVGDTVYAAGSFTEARPAGVPLGGSGSVSRQNILAYSLKTGELLASFNHSITGSGNRIVRAVEASPDGSVLYIGGTFSKVDGAARSNFAAINLKTNTLLPNFTGVNSTVRAITATGSRVYVGGTFTKAGAYSRSMVAAFLTTDGTVDPNWKADVSGPTGAHVAALVAAEPYGNLVIGGSFSAINGATYYSSGAVKLTTGTNVAWGSQSSKYKIRMQVPKNDLGINANSLEITSLTFDGKQVYLTAFTYIVGISHPGTFEGRAAIKPSNGTIIWANSCKGDTYDAAPIGNVLYSVGHPHNCTSTGDFPDQYLQIKPLRFAVAETTTRTSSKSGGLYYSTLLNWFPTFASGTVSGSGQAGWTVEGTSEYIAIGGEFPSVNGTAQQGLVRFAIASKAPNKVAPDKFGLTSYGVTAYPATSKGNSTVRVYTASDRDNTKLTYKVYRSGSSKLLATKTVDSWWWKSNSWTFKDTGVPKGTSFQYTVVVSDGYGNSTSFQDGTLINNDDGRITYKGSSWKKVKGRSDKYPDFGRDIHRTKKNGNYLTFTFTGTSITLLAERGYNLGTAQVSIDGEPATTIDMKYVGKTNSYRYYQAEVYKRTGLSNGKHTIKITKAGGTYLIIDAFKVR